MPELPASPVTEELSSFLGDARSVVELGMAWQEVGMGLYLEDLGDFR